MKYKMTCHVTVTAYCEVEADSTAEAHAKAEAMGVVIGGVNSGANSEEYWVIEEPDGDPHNITAEEDPE